LKNTSVSNITNLKDESIFENVFRSYYNQLVAFAYQYVYDSDLSEELVQEMFTNLWQKIDINPTVIDYDYS
jgi:RNA polymerase sigma-70 factor (ECF subfamily)